MQVFIPTLQMEVEALGKLFPPYSLLLSFRVSGEAVSTCRWKDQAESTQVPSRTDATCRRWDLLQNCMFSLQQSYLLCKKSLLLHNKQTLENGK